jgi:phosphomethylpyrimidine synthase
MGVLIEELKSGKLPVNLSKIAQQEECLIEDLVEGIINGTVVVPKNKIREITGVAIGSGLRTKINANIGTSIDYCDLNQELDKLKVAIKAGADTVMDLSTAGDLDEIRKQILAHSEVPIGTVPIYQVAIQSQRDKGNLISFTADDLFKVIERQVKSGVDFLTVHVGITQLALETLAKQGRVMDIVSRGGAFLSAWMLHNQEENPLYSQFDRLLEIAYAYDVTLSLGDGMRPGCLADGSDTTQFQELITLAELVDKAHQANVQVMVEGPGHLPLDQIEANVRLEKSLCQGAPFYVLGPLVTDIAAGYDHISAAIGGAIAAAAGADFLCYVTPREHLGLPTVEDIHQGVVACRIAAHAADVVKKVPGAANKDHQMAEARRKLDWQKQRQLAIDPRQAKKMFEERKGATKACTMCSDFCAMKLVSDYLRIE